MKVCKQQLAGPQPGTLRRLRLLHLQDKVGIGPNRISGDHVRAALNIFLIGEPRAEPSAPLDQHIVAMACELLHGSWGQPDAPFAIFDLLGNPDTHETL